MNVKVYVDNLVRNLFEQVTADARHRAFYTPLVLMQHIVENVNKAYEHALIGQEVGVGAEVWERLEERLKMIGYHDVANGLDPAGVGVNRLENTQLPWSLSA